VNIWLAYCVAAPGSDEPAVAHAQPEIIQRRIPCGVILHHRSTTSELPFT
jgi:hypothetical protein